MAAYTPLDEFVLAGLFPRSGWPVGDICQASAEMAIEEINARTDLLPNTQLKYYWADTLSADTKGPFGTSFLGQLPGQMITDDRCEANIGICDSI